MESGGDVCSGASSIWFETLQPHEQHKLDVAASSDTTLTSEHQTPDLVVVGVDLVGLAVGYFAAEAGARVLVLASSPRLAVDAANSLGGINPNANGWQFSEQTHALAQVSRDWWAKLAVRPGFQIDWRVTGALMVDASRLIPDARQQMMAGLEAGYSLHAVDAEQIALLEPALAPCPAGGLQYPSEAVIHPLRAVLGFTDGLKRRGTQIVVGTVNQVRQHAHRITELDTSLGVIRPRAMFTADRLKLPGALPDPHAQVEPTCRTFLVSAPQPPLLSRPVLDSSWMIQLKSGEVLIEVASDQAEVIALELQRVRQLVPALSTVEFDRCWSGTSHRTLDRTPIIDRLPEAENVWYCAGLDFSSVLLAPIIGKLVADAVLTGHPDELLAPFAARNEFP